MRAAHAEPAKSVSTFFCKVNPLTLHRMRFCQTSLPKLFQVGDIAKCLLTDRSSSECYYPIKLKPGHRGGAGTELTRRVGKSFPYEPADIIERLEDQCQHYEQMFAELQDKLAQAVITSQPNQQSTPMGSASHAFQVPPVILPQRPGELFGSMTPSGLDLSSVEQPNSRNSTAPTPSRPSPRDFALSAFTNMPPNRAPVPPAATPNYNLLHTLEGPDQDPHLPSLRSGISPNRLAFPNWSPLSFPDPEVLPSPDIVRDLIDLYWSHIHPWAPILGPTHVTPAQIRAERRDPQQKSSYCRITMDPPWDLVVHAIVVITLRLSKDPRLEGRKQHYHQAAKQHVIAHAIESTSITSLQALTLLALDLIGSEQSPSSWGILALLTRSVVHLNLSIEEKGSSGAHPYAVPPVPSLSRTNIIPPSEDWHEDEARRRLFWLIFVLDRCACVSTGWDFAVSIYDITRRLPCADEIWARRVGEHKGAC